MLFTGHYEHSIDAKFRLAIPSEIRSLLDQESDGPVFYAMIGPNDAVWLWPARTFMRIADEIESSAVPTRELMEFDEVTFPEAQRVEMDKSGRIRLAEEMLQEAQIGSKVMILGMRNHLELRDPEQWRQRRNERAARRGEIMQRARPAIEQRKHRSDES